MDLNRILLIGNLTRDPEARNTPSGAVVTKFDIAVNDRSRGRDKEETMFIRVETWNKTAEIANQYLRKGSSVLVEGRLKIDEYETRDGQKRRDPVVVADRISLGPKREGAAGESGGGSTSYRREEAAPRSEYRPAADSRRAPEPARGQYSDVGDIGGGESANTEDDLPF
ncbi:single-stranded DNA-binding protein [bacterium]|nr:single-stranded DNA-binding protein [bacterium]